MSAGNGFGLLPRKQARELKCPQCGFETGGCRTDGERMDQMAWHMSRAHGKWYH